MKKIILKNCDTKEFSNLLRKSNSLDNMIYICLQGSEFESTSYNATKSALKDIHANLEEYCDGFTNECGDETVKIQFSNSNKLISVLSLAGSENVDVTFFIEDNGYAKKVLVENVEINLTVPAADKEAMQQFEIPERARYTIFEDTSTLQYKVGIGDNEFKYLTQLFGINKESLRVCFSISGNTVNVSEIESADENVRDIVNGLLEDSDIEKFDKFEKLYSKKLNCDAFEKADGVEGYLRCFNKTYFPMIDADKHYDIEFHSNKIKFISVDEKGTKTYVVFTPVAFV